MGTPYLSEIRIVSFNFAPRGWALCNGQTLSINQNQALFALLGTTYGGDGVTNFKLPNLQASMPLHQGNGFNLGNAFPNPPSPRGIDDCYFASCYAQRLGDVHGKSLQYAAAS